MAEPLWPFAGPLGQKAGELSGVSPFCLRLDRFSGRWVIRMGSYNIVFAFYKMGTVEWFFIEMQEYRL